MKSSKQNWRTGVLGVAGAVALLGTSVAVVKVVGGRDRAQAGEDSGRAEVEDAFDPRAADAASAADPWTVGKRYRNGLDYRTELRLGSLTGDAAFDARVRGTWVWTVVSRDRDEAWVHAVIEQPEFEVTAGRKTDAAVKEVEAEYGNPIAFAVSLNDSDAGAIERVKLPEGLSIATQTSFRSLVASSQFVRPRSVNPVEGYDVREVDATGRYRAHYSADEGRYEKSKTGYEKVLSKAFAGRTPSTEIVNYAGDYEWTPQRGLISLDLLEIVQVEDPGILPLSQSRVELSIEQLAIEDASDEVGELLALVSGFVEVPLYGEPTAGSLRAEKDAAWIAGMSFADMVAAWDGLDESDVAQRQKAGRVYMGMTALMRQDEEAATAAAEAIRAGSEHADRLIDALGDSGSPHAQDALIGLYDDDRVDESQKLKMLRALTFAGEPTEQTMDKLGSLLDDKKHGPQAHFGTGSGAYRLRQSGRQDEADAAADELFERLDAALAARDIETAVMVLKALGNAGDPRALAAVEPIFSDPLPKLRVYATDAIRRVNGLEVDRLLATVARADSSAAVRTAAVKVMGHRAEHILAFQTLEKVVREDSDGAVRTAAVAVLTKAKYKPDAVRPIMEFVVANDKSPSSVAMAKKWLATHA